MNKMTLRDVDLKGKKVIMRVDFNVPVKEGVIKDDTRIKGALPSIKYVLDNGGKLILMSHMGRPDEKGITPDTSMKIVADYLGKMLGKDITFVADCAKADAEVAAMKEGDIVMLENTRYHKEEQAKCKQKDGESDADFKARKAALKDQQKELAKKLASYGDIYCNDAFGTAHRAHASTAVITKYIGTSVAGFLMEKEIAFLGNAVEKPVRPFVVIDDGWQLCHTSCCNGGPWDRSNYRFPDMKALAEKINARGMRPGIWFRPLLTSECYPDECYLRRDPDNTNPDSLKQRTLDPSHPYVLNKVREMMRGLSAWGYELIKHDFSTWDIFGRWGFRMGEEMTESAPSP